MLRLEEAELLLCLLDERAEHIAPIEWKLDNCSNVCGSQASTYLLIEFLEDFD